MSDELIDPLAIAKLNLERVEASLPDYVRALKSPYRWGTYDEILVLWADIDELTAGTKINRVTLGRTFRQLRDIYSNRNIGGNRRTSGHGTFEMECQQRRYEPRTVRDLIAEDEAFLSGKPSAAEKRKARQQHTPTTHANTIISDAGGKPHCRSSTQPAIPG